MLSMALDTMLAQGYVYIGMDHFALPNDALAVAKRQGVASKFSGYSTQPDCDLWRWGCRPLAESVRLTVRNAKTLEEYYDA